MKIKIVNVVTSGRIRGEWVEGTDDFIFTRKLDTQLILSTGVILHYRFLPGYRTDFASVPKRLRGLIDNTAPDMRLPAVVHDINFKVHMKSITFWVTNKIFRQMIRKAGGSRWRAFWAWVAVSTRYARRLYNKKEAVNIDKSIYRSETVDIWWDAYEG